MNQFPCPYCGPRDETEFSYGDEADSFRPEDPEALTDKEWAHYLYFKKNTRGVHDERWCHQHGCRRWFVLVRDTVTHRIVQSCAMEGDCEAPAETEMKACPKSLA